MAGADEEAPVFDWDGAARTHAAAQERAWDEQMYANHEEWLQNSWGGWAVRTIRGFADNSFFRAIADSLNGQDGEQTATSIILSNGARNGARLAVILAMILLTLAAGYVIQLIVGQDIVVEQEVIVEEEIREGDEEEDEEDAKEDDMGPREEVVTRRGARDRKKDK